MEVKIEENKEAPFYHSEHFFILREAENFRNLLNEMKEWNVHDKNSFYWN